MFKDFFLGKKAVTFDMDGTLVASRSLWHDSYKAVCNEIGLIWPGLSEDTGGKSMGEIWKLLLSSSDVPIEVSIEELCKRSNENFLHKLPNSGLTVRDGFWPLALSLKEDLGTRLGLVTNSKREVVDTVLAHLGISKTFDFSICGDEVKNPKPNPEIYNAAVKQFNLSPKEILAFEDSVVGATAAQKAGIDVIAVWDGTVSDFKYPSNTVGFINNFSDLVGSIDKTFNEMLQEAAEVVAAEDEK